ncbi:MAG: HIT family protein [Bacteroidetes bacterium]|jgi:histidine triad (HIT) family protein|nr:HIT family protein [Bacteroidota bacterium]
MASIFTRIVQGEIPCYKVAESDDFLAFLDINPLKRGHVLVIPKTEINKFFDLPPQLLSGLMLFAQRVAKAMELAIPCQRIGMAVVGLEVPHAHIHLVPLTSAYDIEFSRPKASFTHRELEGIAQDIAARFI